MDVGVVDREARVPDRVALGVLARQVGRRPRRSCRSRSGRPCVQLPQVRQRSATSSQRGFSRLRASRSRMSVGVELPAHRARRRRSTAAPAAARSSALRRRGAAGSARTSAPALAARPRRGGGARRRGSRSAPGRSPLRPSGPVPIETQKQVPRGLEAVDGDDERVLAPRGVVAVGDSGRRGRRGPGSRSRAARRRARRCSASGRSSSGSSSISKPAVAAACLPEPDARREQELLPRVRADRIAEASLVVAALEPVAARRPGSSVQPIGRSAADSSSS